MTEKMEEAPVVDIRRRRRKKTDPGAKPTGIANHLHAAIRLAIARRRPESREAAVREETLLEVLQMALRRAE